MTLAPRTPITIEPRHIPILPTLSTFIVPARRAVTIYALPMETVTRIHRLLIESTAIDLLVIEEIFARAQPLESTDPASEPFPRLPEIKWRVLLPRPLPASLFIDERRLDEVLEPMTFEEGWTPGVTIRNTSQKHDSAITKLAFWTAYASTSPVS